MKKLITIIAILIAGVDAFAQRTVKGTVLDTDGEPVIGAVVLLDGKSGLGTETDKNGHFSLSVPDTQSGVLVVNLMGYRQKQLPIPKTGSVDIVLEEDQESLDAAVSVGYGAMRKSDITGSVASVRIDEDNSLRSVTLDRLLDGRVAGVQVLSDSGNPDAGISVRVRGIATFSGNSDPLYVVDGVIVNGKSSSLTTFGSSLSLSYSYEIQNTNPLAGINPNDIATIEVLKDASATAIYGSQGANGVVLISTKQAVKDKPVVNYSAGVSVATPSKFLDLLSFDEFMDMLAGTGNDLSRFYDDPVSRTGLKVTPIDWQDYATRKAVTQRHYLSISGKSKGYNYFFSMGYNKAQGIMKNADSDNISARLNLTKRLSPSLKLGFKSTFGYTQSNLVNGSNFGSTSGVSSIMMSIQRTKPWLWKTPSEEMEDEETAFSDDESRFSPRRHLTGTTNISERFRVTPALTLDWNITKWLIFRSTAGGDFTDRHNTKTRDSIISNGIGNIAGYGDNRSLNWNWDNLLIANFAKKLHAVSVTLGQSVSRYSSSSQSYSASMLPQTYAWGADINDADTNYSYISGFGESYNSLLSYFARAIYNYDDRYILTSTLRFDGSSRFIDSNKWGVFPSAALAWRLSNEPWFNLPVVSNAKLRFGWGMTGNQNIGSYLTSPIYSTTFVANHYNESGKEVGISQTNIVNRDLKWETTTQLNAGLDLELFHGRLALSLDVYQKDTRDLLQSKMVAASSGFSNMSVNDGHIRNKGVEISLDTVPVKTGLLEWSVGGNITFNRNMIVMVGSMGNSSMIRLDDISDPVQANYFYGSSVLSSYMSLPANIFIEGQPMGLFVGYMYDGIVQEGETVYGFGGAQRDAGTTKFKDLNGDNQWSEEDWTIIGDPNPDFTYGFNTTLRIKRLSASIDFAGCYGNDIANLNNVIGYYTNADKNMRKVAVEKAWTPENPDTDFPKLGVVYDSGALSSRFIEDGSYLRISNISLAYDFPIPKNSRVLHGLGIVLSVGNPLTWTKYSGYSPVVNPYGNDITRMGIDLNTTPFPRTYNLDVKFTF